MIYIPQEFLDTLADAIRAMPEHERDSACPVLVEYLAEGDEEQYRAIRQRLQQRFGDTTELKDHIRALSDWVIRIELLHNLPLIAILQPWYEEATGSVDSPNLIRAFWLQQGAPVIPVVKEAL